MGVTRDGVCGTPFLKDMGEKKGRAKIEQTKIEQRCMQVKTQMKCKVGKDPEGGNKKRKEVGNESSLTSKFQNQQTVNDLNKARVTYNAILEKGKELGLDETVLVAPVPR